MDYLEIFIQEIAEAGIYAVLLVLGFCLFYVMHKAEVKRLDGMMDKSINSIKEAYKDANDSLYGYIEKHPK